LVEFETNRVPPVERILPATSRVAHGETVPIPTREPVYDIVVHDLVQFTGPNLSAPVFVNPITACHVGAVEVDTGKTCERSVLSEVHVRVPYVPEVVLNPVRTDHVIHGHVMRSKYVPNRPSAA